MTARIYTAPWCAACKSVIPQLEQLLKDNNVSYEIIDCNLPENYYQAMHITALPAIRIYKFIETPDCCTDLICIYEKQGNIMFSEVRKVLGE
jgi:thiol-disulfide isomerase/thioredoxin